MNTFRVLSAIHKNKLTLGLKGRYPLITWVFSMPSGERLIENQSIKSDPIDLHKLF